MSYNMSPQDAVRPAVASFAITASDSEDLDRPIRMLTVYTEGVVSYVNWQGETCTTGTLPTGSYPMEATRILSTGTTASDLTGWA